MKKAIITFSGHQYQVAEGETIIVDRQKEDQHEIVINEVNAIFDDKDIKFGQPFIENAKVKLTFVNDLLGRKIHIQKFHRRKRYLKRAGYRGKLTEMMVKEIL